MIKKFKSLIEKVIAKPTEKDIQCAIDDNIIDCKDLKEDYNEGEAFKDDAINYYTGVPAPVYLEDDPWFGPAPERSEKQLDYMQQETIIKQQQAQEAGREYNGEPCSIHQLMYEMATSNWNTVDETKEAIGGSENFHEGPGGWKSGNGMSQFTR